MRELWKKVGEIIFSLVCIITIFLLLVFYCWALTTFPALLIISGIICMIFLAYIFYMTFFG